VRIGVTSCQAEPREYTLRPMGLQIERVEPNLLRLVGEVDFASFGPLREALNATTGAVTVDVSGVTFMDSTGLRVILERLAAGPVTLASPTHGIVRLIELCGLTELAGLTIEPAGPPSS
jgi:anti-sigma B factor antagonist